MSTVTPAAQEPIHQSCEIISDKSKPNMFSNHCIKKESVAEGSIATPEIPKKPNRMRFTRLYTFSVSVAFGIQ